MSPARVERWRNSLGHVFEVIRYSESSGECQVYKAVDAEGNEVGHMTFHAGGRVNRHGVFEDLEGSDDSILDRLKQNRL